MIENSICTSKCSMFWSDTISLCVSSQNLVTAVASLTLDMDKHRCCKSFRLFLFSNIHQLQPCMVENNNRAALRSCKA